MTSADSSSRREFLKLGLAALSSAALPLGSGCCPSAIATRYKWNNALFTAGIDPDNGTVLPANLQELVTLVQRAQAEKVGVRMTGAGHSFSDVAMSSGYMALPWKLSKMLELDRDQLKAEYRADKHLVRTECGARLRSLNPALFQAGLALENMGGYDAQTIVGAALTGTHGSGLQFGPMASQIVSFQLVTAGGAVWQVEPSAGITDPAKFSGQITTGEGSVPATLKQDDELFNALAVSMGCLGIVYAVVLRTVPRYWLREVRTLTTWGALTATGGFLERLLHGQSLISETGRDPAHYEIYVNPYPPKKGGAAATHHCILTERYHLDEQPKTLSPDERKRGRWGTDLTATAALVTGRGELLADFFNAHPEAVPGALDQVLESLRDDSYIDVSYGVFNLGPPNTIRAYGVELAFDIKDTVAAVERHFKIAADLRDNDIVHSSPPSLRFVKRSDAMLAMMYGRDTMMFEIGALVRADGADQLLKTYERKFITELSARPHWGLDLNIIENFRQVTNMYPAAERWRAVYEQCNRFGTFNAELTDRLDISVDADS